MKCIKSISTVLILTLCLICLSSCGIFQKTISDYTPYSTIYGWIDINDLDADKLLAVVIHQSRPKIDKPYYFVNYEKLKDGYIFYQHSFLNGAFKLENIQGKNCLAGGFFCSNTMLQYNFGKQGNEIGAIRINKPGAYYIGSYKFKKIDTGFFEQGKFDVEKAKNAPSEAEMLAFIVKRTPEKHPVVARRIRQRMASLKN